MSALAPLLMSKLAAGGGGGMPGMDGGGGPPGGPGTGPASTPADAMASANFGRELSSARQADPGALAKQIHDLKMQIGEILNSTLASTPGVARHLAKVISSLDGAIEEATKAAATLSIAQPIQASAAMGAPGAGGPNPSPVGVPGIGQF